MQSICGSEWQGRITLWRHKRRGKYFCTLGRAVGKVWGTQTNHTCLLKLGFYKRIDNVRVNSLQINVRLSLQIYFSFS